MDADLESKSASEPGEIEKTDSRSTLKLDPHGYPLRPQPTDDPRGENTRDSGSIATR